MIQRGVSSRSATSTTPAGYQIVGSNGNEAVMSVDRQKLYESPKDFFDLSGSVVMKLSRAAAIGVCRSAAEQGLLVAKIEGGIARHRLAQHKLPPGPVTIQLDRALHRGQQRFRSFLIERKARSAAIGQGRGVGVNDGVR